MKNNSVLILSARLLNYYFCGLFLLSDITSFNTAVKFYEENKIYRIYIYCKKKSFCTTVKCPAKDFYKVVKLSMRHFCVSTHAL